jgi:hypothetical protein
MSTLLNTITGTTTPDPTAYTNQLQVNEQTAEAKASANSTLSSISSYLGFAQLAGISSSVLNPLYDLQAKAQELVSSTDLSPAAIEKKRQELEAQLLNAQNQAATDINAQRLKDIDAAYEGIQTTVIEVRADTTTSPALLQKYEDLLTKAEETKAALAAATPESPAPDDLASAESLLQELESLNIDKEAEESKEFSWSRVQKKTTLILKKWMLRVLLAFCAIVGGLVLLNHYSAESFLPVKLFYFAHGAAFFPLSLLFGIYRFFRDRFQKGVIYRLSIFAFLTFLVTAYFYDFIGYLSKGG